MPQFADLPLAILRSISAVSGESYRDIDGEEILIELQSRGFEPSPQQLSGVMSRLIADNYVEAYARGGMRGYDNVRLGTRGRQAVEGWPTAPGSISTSDIEQLIEEIQARAADETLSDDERTKAGVAASAIGDMGKSVTAGVILGWLQHLGIR